MAGRSDDAWTLGAVALTDAYARGETSPVEVVETFLARIDALDGEINAYTALNSHLRDQAAESAERLRQGTPRGPLEGVPIAVKDNLVAAGMSASWGSMLLRDQVHDVDELPIARLRSAGALVIGKTNCPEFAVEGYTANATFGVTRNPYDLALTPGGSSGGSVAAVAAGLATAAIGTDGGGSLRRPPAYTGLFGFKPGLGHGARADGLPQVLLDFEVVGPLTRTVADGALIAQVLRGSDPRDPMSYLALPEPVEPPRLLFVPTFGDAPCDPAIRVATRRAVDVLADIGLPVEEGHLPFDIEPLADIWGRIPQAGLSRLRRRWPGMRERASPLYNAMADDGDGLAAADLWEALDVVAALRSKAVACLANGTIVATPSCAAMPWPAERSHPDEIDGRAVGPRGHAIYTGWVNAAGLPAVALPAPVGPGALPIGIQLVGGLGSEARLLEIAAAYEAASPWAHRRPPVRDMRGDMG